MLAHQVIAWLLTYLLHGTLLLGLAWLVSKPLSRWSVQAEETVWKLALVGALFTTTLQLAAGWEPLAGRWGLADLAVPAVQAEETVVPVASPSLAVPVRPRVTARVPSPLAETPASRPRLSLPSVPALALGAWAAGALLLLTGYIRSFARLRRRLKNRPRVVGGTLHSQLRSLVAEAGFAEAVELSCSSRVPVPLALGLRRPEICVPPRALAGLTAEQQEGMLAHELAHLARRDPLWLVLSHALACVFFFQPLNWVARRRLREISEMLSDEWAVTRTGRPLSLAGCLAEVAGWSVARRSSLPVPGMADRPSHLAQRIRRLLEGRSPESPARRIWLGAAMVVLLIAVAAAAPAVSAARQEASAKPGKPAVNTAQATPADTPKTWLDEPGEPGGHEVAEEQEFDRHVNDVDDEDDFAVDPDVDVDVDVDVVPDIEVDPDVDVNFDDVDIDVDGIVETSLASMDAALEAMDAQLEGLSNERALTEEEQQKLEREIERTNERIEKTLKPRLEQLSREISEKVSREMPTPEMRRLEDEMRKLGEQMRPSHEERARLRAQVDEEVRKHRADGELSREERERIAREAREMAERMRPTPEQRRAMEDLRRQHHELSRQYMDEHREEMEKATREMREDIEREMNAARQELRRSVEERRLREREERRDHQRERERDRNRDRDKERGEEKPPKMVLQIDTWGHLRLVPESSGC
ncbi:MAG TPA: M56 family metallopeptidase [Thermoanaerobaculia bacterium]|jgi:beta-lactamase regulating signal transducer with metallopeptidase domain|nr:M56 family metallopeptidase [Thermoanaerobaculia bacterium]